MTFTLFKFLHILMMFIAVSAAVIPEVVLHWVSRSGDVGAIRVVAGIAARLGKLLPVFFVGGAVFGLLAAATGELDFFQPWLIGAYIIFVIAMATGGAITGPWAGRWRPRRLPVPTTGRHPSFSSSCTSREPSSARSS